MTTKTEKTEKQKSIQSAPREKLNMTSTIAYSIGSSGANASFYMINNYLMLFYTDVVTLSAAAISLIMLIARIWDAANDPMMGVIEDRTHSKLGKFRPWLVVGPPFLAVFNVLTFTVFPLQGVTKAVVCALCYIGAGMSYTVVQVAINGLVNRITNDSANKMKVISISQIANQIGQAAVAAALMPIILHFSGSNVANAKGYFMGTLILSLVTLPMIWFAAWKCREVNSEAGEDTSASKQKKKKGSVLVSLKAMLKNDQLVAAITATFVSCIATIGRSSMLSYYLIYVIGGYELVSPVFTILTVAQMIGNIPLPKLTEKFGKKRVFVTACLVQAVVLVVMFFAGAMPKAAVIALSAIIGLCMASGSCTYAFICDCVEYGDWKFSRRDDGLAFSMMSFGVKLASAISGAVGVPLLMAAGYVANQAQSAGTLTAINALVNLAPAIILLIAMIPLTRYKLDGKMMEKISADLAERRSTAAKD